MTDVVIGIDIGGTITKIGLIEKNGNCISKVSFRTKETKSFNDFINNIAIRNNYVSSRYILSNYETKKSNFKDTIHTFSWYDLKNNFLGYWIISDNLKNIVEVKFDKKGKIYLIEKECSVFNNNNIGELIWK